MLSNLQPETRTFLKWLAGALTILTVLIVLLDACTNGLDEGPFKKMFDLTREANVPTWFASVLWLSVGAAAVCSFLAERVRNGRGQAPPLQSLADTGRGQAPPLQSLADTGKGQAPPLQSLADTGKGQAPPLQSLADSWRGQAVPPLQSLADTEIRKTGLLRFSWMWLIIAAVFFIASADEVATIHEEIGSLLDHSFESGAFGTIIGVGQQAQMAPESPWIIYYLPLLSIFGLSAGSFLFWRMRKIKMLLIGCFLAADCYAIAIALDHYQGLPLFRKDPIAAALHMQTKDLLNLSFWTEEIIEDIGTALLVVAFSGYACEQFVRRKEE